jgi:hypothetical protein
MGQQIDTSHDPLFRFLRFVWFCIKLAVISAILVGFGASAQCHHQFVEICQLVGGCK